MKRVKTMLRNALLLIPTTLLLTTGCQAIHKSQTAFTQWTLDEFGEYQKGKHSPKKFTSTNPKDFIHEDGWATAVPSISDWDLYVSPYAPDKFIRSKEPAGTPVICPYSGKPLILGDRKEINEIDPQ